MSADVTRVVGRRAGIPVASQWRALRPMLAAAGVSWPATRATANWVQGAPPVLALAATVAVCLAVYVAVIGLRDPEVLKHAVRQIRRAMPGRQVVVTPQ